MQKNIEENNEKDLVSYSLFYIFLFLMAIINLPIFITAFICCFLLFRLLKFIRTDIYNCYIYRTL